ncbi:MAG: Rid family hydrolase [Gammaproteobacteria bacterium]|nr:Rid family hydrolase [Gammaproteobacteria bacterium]
MTKLNMYCRLGLLIALLAGTASVTWADEKLGKTIFIPKGMAYQYDEYHYSPAVRVGDTVHISGIPAGGDGSEEDQLRRMFERIKTVLEHSGAGMRDVVKITSFHNVDTDEEFREAFSTFAKIHAEYFPDAYPAWTAVGTTALLARDAIVETEVIAVVGAGENFSIKRQE